MATWTTPAIPQLHRGPDVGLAEKILWMFQIPEKIATRAQMAIGSILSPPEYAWQTTETCVHLHTVRILRMFSSPDWCCLWSQYRWTPPAKQGTAMHWILLIGKTVPHIRAGDWMLGTYANDSGGLSAADGRKLLAAVAMEEKFASEGLQTIDGDNDMLTAIARELVANKRNWGVGAERLAESRPDAATISLVRNRRACNGSGAAGRGFDSRCLGGYSRIRRRRGISATEFSEPSRRTALAVLTRGDRKWAIQNHYPFACSVCLNTPILLSANRLVNSLRLTRPSALAFSSSQAIN